MVISSRIRLARNIDDYPFFLEGERAAMLVKTVSARLSKMDKFRLYRISDFGDMDAIAMMERHLISHDLVKNKKFGAAVVSDDESISIMLNEEDHIREQCILSGLSLEQAHSKLSFIDKTLGTEFKFAYSPLYGYLTSCLTNLGTGMRASVMMFLPALSLTKTLEKCVRGVTRLNMAIRGLYGEGSDSSGYIYQISNQRTLGITESEIVQSVRSAAQHIMLAETKAREYLFRTNHSDIKDKILRSFGTLTCCYKISHSEFIGLIAFIKLGVYYGLLGLKNESALSDFITEMGPASISILAGEKPPLERDIIRAESCRGRIKQLVTVC